MSKVLKNNTNKNTNTNKKSKSQKKTKGGMTSSLRLNLPQGANMDCGPAFHPQWGNQNSSSKQLGLPNMNNYTFNQEGNLGFIQQGGNQWRKHVKTIMNKNPQLKFGKVLSLAKKTYKKKNIVNRNSNKNNRNNNRNSNK